MSGTFKHFPMPAKKEGPNVGDRVYAIRSADKTEVQMYGFGVYIGNKPMKESLQMLTPLGPVTIPAGTPNPVIKLDDSNDEIWGYECHWGPEENFEKNFGSRKIVKVTIAQAKQEVKDEEKRHETALEVARSYVQTLEPNYVGTVGDVRRFEVDGKAFYVIAAFILVDSEGKLLNPDFADTLRVKVMDEAKAKMAETTLAEIAGEKEVGHA